MPNPKFNNKTHNYSSGPLSNRRQDTQNNRPTSQSAIFTAMADNSTSQHISKFIDSAANEHLFMSRSDFIDYQPLDQLIPISLAGEGQFMNAISHGTVSFDTILDNDIIQNIQITDVLHVPNGETNLVSLG